MEARDFRYKGHRNSYTELNELYFWTITINKWQHLLTSDENKMIIINSLQWLCINHLVQIFGYVIMPNHIHLLWMQLKMNGKEFPKNSFEKFTAKKFIEKMKHENDQELSKYTVNAEDRQHNIWQRDPLAIRVFSNEMAIQKLDYMHYNPSQFHWALCVNPEDYRFSSAAYYEKAFDEFNILTHISELG
jgi:REP element-mobilizing transposase RayT